jgi:hypothetical protein
MTVEELAIVGWIGVAVVIQTMVVTGIILWLGHRRQLSAERALARAIIDCRTVGHDWHRVCRHCHAQQEISLPAL